RVLGLGDRAQQTVLGRGELSFDRRQPLFRRLSRRLVVANREIEIEIGIGSLAGIVGGRVSGTARRRLLVFRHARLSYDATDHLGGVVHHRDDPRVVDAGGADDPDRADDLLAAVLVGRDDDGTA